MEENTMNTATEILHAVQKFRSVMGMGNQSDSTHERLYASESIEFLTANDWEEEADALADMAVVIAGHFFDGKPNYDYHKAIDGLNDMAYMYDIDLLEAFKIVMTSNMTKACEEEHIQPTIDKYLKEGVKLTWVKNEGLYTCYAAEDYPDKPKGKLLKPVTYKEPDWSGNSWKTM